MPDEAPHLETTGWYALGIPIFVIVIAIEVLAGRRSKRPVVSFAETLSNLSAGLGTLVIGLFVGPLVLRLYEWGYANYAILDWHGSPWRWPFALLLSDLCYYAHHRAGHRFAFLWAIHGVHHQHEHLGSTVGFRLEWLADLSTVVFFAAMPLLGVDATTGFLAIAALSLYALSTHSPVMARPSFGIFVTPATHGAHHSRDARYADKNFAAMFVFWDKILGTHRAPPKGEELRVDFPTISRFHDGVGAQLVLVRELATAVTRARGLRAKLAMLIGRPVIVPPPSVPRPDSAIPIGARVYLAVDFVITSALATWVLWTREARAPWIVPAVAIVVVWGLRTNGRLLDGRSGAVREQIVRLVVVVGFSIALGSLHPVVAASAAASALVSLGSLVLLKNRLATTS